MISDYERLMGKVFELNTELAAMAAEASTKADEESPTEYGGDRDTFVGRADAYDDAKQLVEKIIDSEQGHAAL